MTIFVPCFVGFFCPMVLGYLVLYLRHHLLVGDHFHQEMDGQIETMAAINLSCNLWSVIVLDEGGWI